jgi:uncharacterized membrane protein YgcG
MRTHIRIITIGGFFTAGAWGLVSPSYAQSLERPVNAPPTPSISLAELAQQVNPGRDVAGATRIYTNADLKVRPAPAVPVTPPFPEIAPPTGILEHPGVPQVQPMELETAPEQYGVPYWDGYGGFGFSPAPPWFTGNRQRFQRPGSVQFGISGRFSKPSTPADILLGPLNNRGLAGSRFGRGGGSHRSGGRGGSHGGRGGSRGSRGR